MGVIKGKKYRVTRQGYGNRKEAKKSWKRAWRRKMNDLRRYV
jgi:hypothetical protein